MSKEIKHWSLTWRDEEWNGHEEDHTCTETEIKRIAESMEKWGVVDVEYEEIDNV